MAVATPLPRPQGMLRDRPPECAGIGYIPGGLLNNVVTGTAVSGLTVEEFGGNGIVRQTKLTLTAMPMTITDSLAYASQLIYTMPVGRILHLGTLISNLTMSVTSANTTINDAAVLSIGIGTAAASSITLATTMQNFSPGSGIAVTNLTAGTNPAASAAFNACNTATTLVGYDGTGTAITVYFNVGIPTNTEIDADATVTFTGTILITWINLGDY